MAEGFSPVDGLDMLAMGRAARAVQPILRDAPPEQRTAALRAVAAEVRKASDAALAANTDDLAAAKAAGEPPARLDRLALTPARIEGIAAGVEAVADQPDPVGVELARWTRPNGLDIARVSTPIGVIGVVYEARPNVGVDAAAIAIRSGNAVILRGGSECLRSGLALHEAVRAGLTAAGLPEACVQMVPTSDRAAVGAMLSGLDGALDLMIPRGGKSLVERVKREARVAVLGHLEGLNATYLDKAADLAKAVAITVNAKMRRTSVCGATETLLVDRAGADRLLPPVAQALADADCTLKGDPEAQAYLPWIEAASEEDWRTEWLDAVINVAVVDGVEGAIAHIARYGSAHTDAIVTEDAAAAEAFLSRVDSAIVLLNASTQFADGGEFGFGAEIGIATDRLHARGPVGPAQLCSFKYVVRGAGQTRP